MRRSDVLAASLVTLLAAASTHAQVTCENVGGTPPDDTRVRIEITSPAPGATIPATSACSTTVRVEGNWLVESPIIHYDFYMVLDTSGSTRRDSGADVNGNGIFGEPADTIYQAEIAAAQAFERELDPAFQRAGVISFSDAPTLQHELSADLVSVDGALERMKTATPIGGTRYVPAMEAVRQESLLRGDPTHRQRCIFLSDGEQNETLAEVEAKASELAAAGIVIDSFALGFATSPGLESMARITGGTFTALLNPGDIVALLPALASRPSYGFQASSLELGEAAAVSADEAAGTFSTDVLLGPGLNNVMIVLTADSVPPVTVQCVVQVTLENDIKADAGPPLGTCVGEPVTLDASASNPGACAVPLYRWVDCYGNEICPSSPDPVCTVVMDPTCTEVTLWLGCEGENCKLKDTTTIVPAVGPTPQDVALSTCPAAPVSLTCGTPEPGATYWWDLDGAVDSDGNTDPSDDADATGCDVNASWPDAGLRDVRAWGTLPGGCTFLIAAGTVDVTLVAAPAETVDQRMSRSGASLSSTWSATPGAVTWRVARGTLASLHQGRAYDHAADDAAGQGACDTAGTTSWSDPDDAGTAGAWYYLVTAVNSCGVEGPPGDAWDGRSTIPRPARLPSASCP